MLRVSCEKNTCNTDAGSVRYVTVRDRRLRSLETALGVHAVPSESRAARSAPSVELRRPKGGRQVRRIHRPHAKHLGGAAEVAQRLSGYDRDRLDGSKRKSLLISVEGTSRLVRSFSGERRRTRDRMDPLNRTLIASSLSSEWVGGMLICVLRCLHADRSEALLDKKSANTLISFHNFFLRPCTMSR